MLSSFSQPPSTNGHAHAVNGSATPSAPRRLASVILLGGSVRASKFHDAVGRWALDLPCTQESSGAVQTLLDAWTAGVAALSTAWNRTSGKGSPL